MILSKVVVSVFIQWPEIDLGETVKWAVRTPYDVSIVRRGELFLSSKNSVSKNKITSSEGWVLENKVTNSKGWVFESKVASFEGWVIENKVTNSEGGATFEYSTFDNVPHTGFHSPPAWLLQSDFILLFTSSTDKCLSLPPHHFFVVVPYGTPRQRYVRTTILSVWPELNNRPSVC